MKYSKEDAKASARFLESYSRDADQPSAKIYKSKSEVLADWKANKISYADAARALYGLGFGPASNEIVENS